MLETNHTKTMAAAHYADAARRDWRQILREAVRDWQELAGLLDVPPQALAELTGGDSDFPLLVPRGFVARMRKGDLDDPLLRQIVPDIRERLAVTGFDEDPVGERARAEAGVIRKYPGRALLVTTAACPVHCRYCFRRHFPYSDQLAARSNWDEAVARVELDETIREVILSGGDPLSLPTPRLAALIARLEQIEHLSTLRIHTRFPIVIPERVDEEFLSVLVETRLSSVVVVHANHPNEVDASVALALRKLASACTALLNQSVLLRGINDSADILCELSERLFASRTLPYYLHMLDPVAGAAHFDVAEPRAVQLVAAIRARLPGYLVPSLVREVPDALSKVLVLNQ